MDKMKFKKALDQILLSHDFVSTKNNWILKNTEINKLLFISRSSYTNSYYIDYGFIINDLELNELRMHVSERLGTADDYAEQLLIIRVLSLDSPMSDEERAGKLKAIIENKVLPTFERITTKSDLKAYIDTFPYLNMIPVAVKEHLKVIDHGNSKNWLKKVLSFFEFH
jgi:hypothetical protein